MATHDKILINGWLREKPHIEKTKVGKFVRASFYLYTVRGVRHSGKEVYEPKFDNILVTTSVLEQIREISKWKAGDIVEISGIIASENVKLAMQCPHCGKEIHKKARINYVQPIFVSKRFRNIPQEKVNDALVKLAELSNQVTILGKLITDPWLTKDQNGVDMVQYSVRCRRQYHVRTATPLAMQEQKYDKIIVKNFGEKALRDAQWLRAGDLVFIEGALVSRWGFDRSMECDGCKKEFHFKGNAFEVAPYETEYISVVRLRAERIASDAVEEGVVENGLVTTDDADERNG